MNKMKLEHFESIFYEKKELLNTCLYSFGNLAFRNEGNET